MKKNYSLLILLLPLFMFSQTTDLIISKYAEGSSNNKFLEIYNGTGADVDLSTYAFPNTNNDPDTVGEYDYWNSFTAGAVIADGDVYVISHGSADATILAEADQHHTYLSNGDDGFKLVKDFTWNDADSDSEVDQGEMTGFTVVDVLGDWQADPGSGWEVAGVNNATKDHTLTRKTSVCSGNTDWASSAGTDANDSEWEVGAQNSGWDTVGSYTTACVSSVAETIPWSDSFETAGLTEWTNTDSSPWKEGLAASYEAPPSAVQDGSSAIYFDDYSYSTGTTATITSPEISLSGATAPQLTFYYADNAATGNGDTVEVVLGDGTVIYTTPAETTDWELQTVDLTAYVGQTITIGFKGTSVWGYSNPHVDNVTVAEAPYTGESLPWSDSFETTGIPEWTNTDSSPWKEGLAASYEAPPSAVQDGSSAVYFDDYSYSTGTTATITSPLLDLTSATAPQLTFYYADNAATGNGDTVEVVLGDGTVIYTTPAETTDWELQTVDLTAYVGQSITIGFKGTSVWGYSNPHVDNVMVAEAPTAASADWDVSVTGSDATISISVNNFTVTSDGSGDGHWHYTVDGGSEVMVYDTNDVVLTGLANGDHTLVAWLTDDSHQALSPAVEETITFSTFDGTYGGTYPYCSSFDTDLDNWTAESVSGDANWSSASANQNSTVTPYSGAGMAYMYDNSSVANLISPSMDISGVTNPQVTFWHTQVEWAGDQDELRVWYKAAVGDAWTELAAYTSEVTAWTEVTLDLPNPSADYYVAFNGTAAYGRGMTVDDVCVAEGPGDPNTVLADPTLGWLGYMNVFDLTGGAQGGYLWGSAWGVPDVATTLNTNTDYMTITLEPNYNAYADNPGDAYWQDGSGGGAKWMEGSTYVESATDWNGADLTFTGYVYHHSLATDWTANFFIKALDPNNGYADALAGAYVTALPTDGVFSVTVPAGELSAGFVVQAGFAVNGPNANPDNQTANGKVILGGDADAPMSIDDVNVLDMRIYPNPVDGNYVTILSPVNGTKYVQVFDINGRRVMDTAINNNTLDVSSINSGFYMIKVTIDGQSKISKLVVR